MNPNKMKKEELIREVIALRDKVADNSATIDDLKQQAKEANALSEEKSSAIDNLKNKIGELDETLICKDKDIAERREANVKLTQELQFVRKQVTSLREDAQGMEKCIVRLSASNTKLKVWKYVAVVAIVAFLITLCVAIA